MNGMGFMPRFSPLKTAVRWAIFNSFYHLLSRRGIPYLRVRYEDFAREPRRVTEQIIRFAGLVPKLDQVFLSEDKFLVTVLTVPWLWRYRYFGVSDARDHQVVSG